MGLQEISSLCGLTESFPFLGLWLLSSYNKALCTFSKCYLFGLKERKKERERDGLDGPLVFLSIPAFMFLHSAWLHLGQYRNVGSHLSVVVILISVAVHSPGLPLLWYFFLLQDKIISCNLDWLRSLWFLRITLQVDSHPVIHATKTWQKLAHCARKHCQKTFCITSTVNIFAADKSGSIFQGIFSVYLKVDLLLQVCWWVLC